LTGVVTDQAALQSLLRRLYSLGLPLISVNWVEPDKKNSGYRVGCKKSIQTKLAQKVKHKSAPFFI
jgi:hypothetical protein